MVLLKAGLLNCGPANSWATILRSCDLQDDEATAAGGILISKIQGVLMEKVKGRLVES